MFFGPDSFCRQISRAYNDATIEAWLSITGKTKSAFVVILLY